MGHSVRENANRVAEIIKRHFAFERYWTALLLKTKKR